MSPERFQHLLALSNICWHLESGDQHCPAFSEKPVKQYGLLSESTSNHPQPLLTGRELLMSSWKVGTSRIV